MATPRVDMKSYYKQKKKAALSKPTKSSKKKKPSHSATIGSGVAQPSALGLISHGGSLDLRGEDDDKEQLLREFDMNMAYGPCMGMSRTARWERANRLGLNPPENVRSLLTSGNVSDECVWVGMAI